MTKTYSIDPDCLQLFIYAAKYSENVGVELLTARLIKLAEDGKATIKNGSGIEFTRDEIRNALTEAWGQRPKPTGEDKLLKRILVSGGIAIGIIGAATIFAVGNAASLAILWGAGGLTATGGIIAIAAVKLIKFSITMPNGIKSDFSTYNEEYGNIFPNPK